MPRLQWFITKKNKKRREREAEREAVAGDERSNEFARWRA